MSCTYVPPVDRDWLIKPATNDLDPLKTPLVIAAGAQRRSLHYWGARNIAEVFCFFCLRSFAAAEGCRCSFSTTPHAFFGLQLGGQQGISQRFFFLFLTALINFLY